MNVTTRYARTAVMRVGLERFKGVDFKFERIYIQNVSHFKYSIEDVSEKLLWIWGFRVGIDSLMIYVGGSGNDKLIPVASFKSLVRYLTGLSYPDDSYRFAMQKYKLIGTIAAFISGLINPVIERSVIYTILSNKEEPSSFLDADKMSKEICAFTGLVKEFTNVVRSGDIKPYKTMLPDDFAFSQEFSQNVLKGSYIESYHELSNTEEDLYAVSTKAFNTSGGGVSTLRSPSMNSLRKSLNLLDLCETFERENEIVYSLSLSDWLKRVKMNKVLSGVENRALSVSWKAAMGSQSRWMNYYNSVQVGSKKGFDGKTYKYSVESRGDSLEYLEGPLNRSLVFIDKLLIKLDI